MKRIIQILPPWTLTIVVSLLILYLTLVPKPLPEVDIPMFPGADKLVHAIMFGSLTGALGLDLARGRGGLDGLTPRRLVGFAIIATLAGGIIELLQAWMNLGRGCEIWDLVADGAGAVIAACVTRPVAGWLVSR